MGSNPKMIWKQTNQFRKLFFGKMCFFDVKIVVLILLGKMNFLSFYQEHSRSMKIDEPHPLICNQDKLGFSNLTFEGGGVFEAFPKIQTHISVFFCCFFLQFVCFKKWPRSEPI